MSGGTVSFAGQGADWPVMLVHNHYRQPGGEEQVFASDAALLKEHGHRVYRFEDNNQRATAMNSVTLGVATIWNQRACRRLESALAIAKPRIVHFHNTFPLISPAVYRTARRAGVAVVQTLHNYRPLCINGLLFRDGKPCEQCLEMGSPWVGVYHRCYRTSAVASAAVASMLSVHRGLQTWSSVVDAYIVPSEFSRQKFIERKFPQDRIVVRPHSLDADPGVGNHRGNYALYAGRLSEEKGLLVLLEAWKRLACPIPLRILGDGPLAERLQGESARTPHIQWLGQLTNEAVLAQMMDATMLVFPSKCYETGALSIVEAFATGLPVVASDHGTMASVVSHGETGLHFKTGDGEDLASQISWLVDHPEALSRMRGNARAEFERRHSRQASYETLLATYQAAFDRSRRN